MGSGGPATQRRKADAAGVTLAWLGHPVTVAALVVLVVNDHVLKAEFPGFVTGKLSDVAGLALAPALAAVVVTLLVPRLPDAAAAAFGLVVVGAGFTAVKASEYGADVASALWSVANGPSVIRADSSDLLALPALALAWWVWSRARNRPASGRLARLVRVLVVLPAALLGVAATSLTQYPFTVAIGEWDGHLVLGQAAGYGHPGHIEQWLTSQDDGRTWGSLTVPGPVSQAQVDVRQDGCVPDEPRHCYRVVPGHLRVEETVDGGVVWQTGWAVSDAARARLAADSYPDLTDLTGWLSSRSLVVRQAAGGGHVVLVANGRDGLARRAPDGTWERIVFPADSETPLVLPGTVSEEQTMAARFADLPAELGLSVVAGCLAFLVAADVAARRAGHRRIVVGFHLVLLLLAVPMLLPAFDSTDRLFRTAFVVGGVGFAGIAAAGALAAVLTSRLVTGRWVLAAAGLAALTTLAVSAPFVLWGIGVLGSFSVAVVLAVLAGCGGLALAVLAGLRARRPGPPIKPAIPRPPVIHRPGPRAR